MDVDAVARLLGERFLSRKDVRAVQHRNGAYTPEKATWVYGDLKRHVRGEVSLGHYLVNPDGKTKLFAFDIDLDKWSTWGDAPLCTRPECQKPGVPEHNQHPREVWLGAPSEYQQVLRRQLRALGEGLVERAHRVLEIPCALAYSGSKGVHVYGFTGLSSASNVRAAAHELLAGHVYHRLRGDNFWKHDDEYQALTIEVFPKQDEVAADGLGNLMRLPLGRNLKGGEAFFLDPACPLDEWRALDPVQAMTHGTGVAANA